MFARSLCVLMFVLSVAAADPGAEKAAPTPEKFIYARSSEFKLPIIIDWNVRPNLSKVQLFAKIGDGDWIEQDSAPATATSFIYSAPKDGRYYFTLVTIDKAGKRTPPSVKDEPPGLRVMVDTTPPVVETKIVREGANSFLHVKIVDENPDLNSIRVCVPLESGERALAPVAGKRDVFRLAAADLASTIVVTARDLSGNEGTKRIPGKEVVCGEELLPMPNAVSPMPPTIQNETGDRPIRLSTRHVIVPVVVDSRGNGSITAIELWVRAERGPWKKTRDLPPRSDDVNFTVDRDGEYAIRVVAIHKSGERVPANFDDPRGESHLIIDTGRAIVSEETLPMPSRDKATPEIQPSRPTADISPRAHSLADLGDDPDLGPWLVKTITEVIEPGTWSGQAGADKRCTVRLYAPQKLLIVTHNAAVQGQVERLLADVRKSLPARSAPSSIAQAQHLEPIPIPLLPERPKSAHVFELKVEGFESSVAAGSQTKIKNVSVRYEGAGLVDLAELMKYTQMSTVPAPPAEEENDFLSVSAEVKPVAMAAVGEKVIYEVVVTNRSKKPLDGVMLIGYLPPGLTHPSGDSIGADLPTLAPGTTKTFKMPLVAKEPGRHSVDIRIRSKKGAETRCRSTIEIYRPDPGILAASGRSP
jgi:uncharacterized repeat protein (TIGR01451 family)